MAIQQLIKWIGNKTKYADEIISLMPEEFNTYIEPFLGSGAVLGALLKDREVNEHRNFNHVIASDSLSPLIGIFTLLQENPERLIEYYSAVINQFNNNREEVYLEVRDRFNRDRNPLDFLVLSRTCYSGVIRFS